MKKLVRGTACLLIGAGALLASSCKKSDASVEERLVGKWNFSRAEIHGEFYGQSLDTTFTMPSGTYYQFDKNGTLSGNQGSQFTGTWHYANNKLLTVVVSDDSQDSTTFDINKLTGSELELHASDTASHTDGIFYMNK